MNTPPKNDAAPGGAGAGVNGPNTSPKSITTRSPEWRRALVRALSRRGWWPHTGEATDATITAAIRGDRGAAR